jgi:serine O-acetyltransferase
MSDLRTLIRGDVARVRDTYGTYLYVIHPGFLAVLGYRLAHAVVDRGIVGRFLARAICLAIILITGADFHAGAEIGPGFFVPHAQGTMFGEHVRAGKHLTLYTGVILGQDDAGGGPKIGDNVTFWTRALAFGDITIGDNAQIGAASLVMIDVPANHNAVGIPAKIRPQRPATVEPD